MEIKSIGRKALRCLAVGCSSLFASVLLGSMPTLAATSPVLNVSMFPIVNGGLQQPTAGHAVTYIYQIWNTGNLPISNVTIFDSKCTLVTYDAVGQDLNVNHQLDKGELWSYYCTIIPNAPTTNVVIVSGQVGGTMVSAVTSANINVVGSSKGSSTGTTGGTSSANGSGSNANGGTPSGLPKTGFGPHARAQAQKASNSVLPIALEIPKLGVNANVEVVGLTANGNMEAPENAQDVAWYAGTMPGQNGNAVVAGHVDTATSSRGIFARLNKLAAGDDVYVGDGSGQSLHFVVNHRASYNVADAPVDTIFGDADSAHLNLVTCDGAWDSRTHQYRKRLVVYTDLVQ